MAHERKGLLPWQNVTTLDGLTVGKSVHYLESHLPSGPASQGTIKDIQILKIGSFRIAKRVFIENDRQIPIHRIVPDDVGHGVL